VVDNQTFIDVSGEMLRPWLSICFIKSMFCVSLSKNGTF